MMRAVLDFLSWLFGQKRAGVVEERLRRAEDRLEAREDMDETRRDVRDMTDEEARREAERWSRG